MKRECNLERALLGKALSTPDLSQMVLKLADGPLHVPILKRDDGVTEVGRKERKGKERGMKRKKARKNAWESAQCPYTQQATDGADAKVKWHGEHQDVANNTRYKCRIRSRLYVVKNMVNDGNIFSTTPD